MRKENILVAISGGRSSARMAHYIEFSEQYKNCNKLYVFANTGQERVETIDFLKNMVEHWGIEIYVVEAVGSDVMGVGINYKLTDLDNLSMNSEPFEQVIMHKTKGEFKGLPNQSAPYCSENMKTIPSKKFADKIFGVNNYVTAIGFREEDTPKRITMTEAIDSEKRIYPLLTDIYPPVNNIRLNRWWDKMPFKLEIHGDLGNCELCWKKSNKTLIENIRHGSRTIGWWQRMEKEHGNTSYRGNLSIDDLIELSSQPTTLTIDFEEGGGDGCVCTF